jgi:DNA recombination protein RmuC
VNYTPLIQLSLISLLIIISIVLIFLNIKTKSLIMNMPKSLLELKEKILILETSTKAKLDDLPKLVKETQAQTLEVKFSEIKESSFLHNQNLSNNFNEFKNQILEKTIENQEKSFKNLNHFKNSFQSELRNDFEKLNNLLESKMDKINQKVQENLDEGFKKTNQTFTSIIERLSKIDEAQKKIESLSKNVVSLQDILTDKKSRGVFGEVLLNQVLNSIFGENNKNVFQTQYKLSTGVIVDAMIFLPQPTGNISVDSKFPLENYQRMVDLKLTSEERTHAQKQFKTNIKKHIDDISKKYIINNETSDQAILFLPAEAIFAELNAYHQDLIEYSNKKKVWITSPTTFMAVLTSIQILLQNIDRNKYVTIIQEELNKLGVEFKRYQDRWSSLSKNINKVSSDVKDIHTTSEKISKRFTSIEQVKLTNKDTTESMLMFED